MGKILDFKELIVWQKSHELVLRIYQTTTKFPKEELFSLTNQLKRAAVSIPANIAEGFRKKTFAHRSHYISHSEGSLDEVNYYILLAKDLNYISEKDYLELHNLCDEVGKLITAYHKTIKNYYATK